MRLAASIAATSIFPAEEGIPTKHEAVDAGPGVPASIVIAATSLRTASLASPPPASLASVVRPGTRHVIVRL
ncbi:hypothetical protein ASG43_05305 [Aureimonas sp. Leaf454]|nr:hypothetical protein ASG43_05305 [Aureimonas sp. Leaf454]